MNDSPLQAQDAIPTAVLRTSNIIEERKSDHVCMSDIVAGLILPKTEVASHVSTQRRRTYLCATRTSLTAKARGRATPVCICGAGGGGAKDICMQRGHRQSHPNATGAPSVVFHAKRNMCAIGALLIASRRNRVPRIIFKRKEEAADQIFTQKGRRRLHLSVIVVPPIVFCRRREHF